MKGFRKHWSTFTLIFRTPGSAGVGTVPLRVVAVASLGLSLRRLLMKEVPIQLFFR